MKKATLVIQGVVLVGLLFGIMNEAHALQGEFGFQSLSYGRGWAPWNCLVEQDVKPRPRHEGKMMNQYAFGQLPPTVPQCEDIRPCPFESMAFGGYRCNTEAKVGVTTGLAARLSIPEDVKLVTLQGKTIVGDSVCQGEKIQLQVNAEKGEWFFEGGFEDTPPIYWVDSVEDEVRRMMEYHENTETLAKDFCTTNPQKVEKDSKFGYPVHYTNTRTWWSGSLAGTVLCSVEGLENKKYATKGQDTVNIDEAFPVTCSFFHYGDNPRVRPDQFCTTRVPTIIQNGPDSASAAYFDVHNREYNTIQDFFHVGNISVNKELEVVDPNPAPQMAVNGTITDTDLAKGHASLMRVTVQNTGTTAFTIDKVRVNVPHKIKSCDARELASDETAECLIEIRPRDSISVDVSVEHSYTNCGTAQFGRTTNEVSSVSVQVAEKCTKTNDCETGQLCCNNVCRETKSGVCEDIDGDATAEWVYDESVQ